jgi:hypothetical protein
MKGKIPTSNETAPVRGNAKNGPIVKYNNDVNITANTGCTLLERSCKFLLPENPIASVPKKGKLIPVTKNPKIAIHTFDPAYCPKLAGKIKFPAPKNNANNITPITR